MRLKNKVAVVTGGGSGFGAGICAKFVREGAQVVVADINLQAAMDVAAALGPAARALRVDVTDSTDVRLMMEAAELHFGRLDILVNSFQSIGVTNEW
jgi:NAD(P)-dependent dehydrogenase (short-subunit alcohol dehydrogenase family)